MSDLASRIINARFQPVRLKEGYDMGEVDAFLDRAARAARAGEPLAPLLGEAHFASVRLREGYDMAAVDAFLLDLASRTGDPREADEAGGDDPQARARNRLVSRITAAHLSPVRLREGYETSEVDAFLRRAAQAAGEGEPLAPLVAQAGFTPVRLREGYDMAGVDALLADLASLSPDVSGTPDEPDDAEGRARDGLRTTITAVRFTPVRLREGYDMHEVDAFLDRLVVAVDAGEPLAQLCHEARFTPVRLKEGYDTDEVDDFLAEVSGPSGPGSTPGAPERHTAEADDAAPSVVEEQRGALSRFFRRRD